MVHACDISTSEVETGGPGVQDQIILRFSSRSVSDTLRLKILSQSKTNKKQKSNGVAGRRSQKREAPPSVLLWPIHSKFPGSLSLGEGMSLQLLQTLTVGSHLLTTVPTAGQ